MPCWIWLSQHHLQKQPGHSTTFICAEPSQTPPIPTRLNDGKDGAPNPSASSHPFLRISTGHQHVGSSFCTTWDLQGAGKAQWGQVPLLHPAEVLPCAAGADPGHPGESHRVTLLSLPTLLHPEINPTQVCWSILMFAFIFMRLKAVFV